MFSDFDPSLPPTVEASLDVMMFRWHILKEHTMSVQQSLESRITACATGSVACWSASGLGVLMLSIMALRLGFCTINLFLCLARVPCWHLIYCVLSVRWLVLILDIHACCSLQYYELLLLLEVDPQNIRNSGLKLSPLACALLSPAFAI